MGVNVAVGVTVGYGVGWSNANHDTCDVSDVCVVNAPAVCDVNVNDVPAVREMPMPTPDVPATVPRDARMRVLAVTHGAVTTNTPDEKLPDPAWIMSISDPDRPTEMPCSNLAWLPNLAASMLGADGNIQIMSPTANRLAEIAIDAAIRFFMLRIKTPTPNDCKVKVIRSPVRGRKCLCIAVAGCEQTAQGFPQGELPCEHRCVESMQWVVVRCCALTP